MTWGSRFRLFRQSLTRKHRQRLTLEPLELRCNPATINGKVHKDIAWGYDHPLVEAEPIAGLVSFYNEKVDVYVDEVLEGRSATKYA